MLLLICIQVVNLAIAQTNAVTETGDEVILYENGTWVYKNGEDSARTEITTNPEAFTKGKNASFLLKSKRTDVGVWLDPKRWDFGKATTNPQAEYELKLKKGDLYAMLIAEEIEVPLKTLRDIALTNGQKAAPDLHIVKEEYRTVNDITVMMLQMDGTFQGIKVAYYGYYFSNEQGTVQFITYTSQNLLKEYHPVCEELLNGFVVIE